MEILIVLALLWFFFAPFFIMGKIGGQEERLGTRLEELKAALDTIRLELRQLKGGEATSLPLDPAPQETLNAVVTDEVQNEAQSRIQDEVQMSVEPLSEIPVFTEVPVPENVSSSEALPEEDELPLTVEAERPFVAAASFAPEEPEEPREPGLVSVMLRRLLSWLVTEGNIWVCAGVALFFVGFGLLFNYAIQIGVLSLELRLAGAAATGIVMTVFGFRMRERRRNYALILQGGGMGVLYLVVLAATKLTLEATGLVILPPPAAIAAMLLLSVFTVLLALLQDFQPLALFAILGGFVAPILVSTGSRDHVALFSIYSLLNLEILLISFKRNWRVLNRMGFILTVGIGIAWGHGSWTPELFGSVQPFLLVFLATYTLISIRVAHRDADLPLSVATPFSFFFLQMQVAGHITYGMALTCLGLGLWYLCLGAWLLRRGDEYPRVMSRLFIALSLLFSNLVVPYAFESVASSAIWAVEGAFLIVVASRFGNYKALFGGIVLHVGALALYSPQFAQSDWMNAANLANPLNSMLSPIFVSGILFAASHLISGFRTTRFRPSSDGPLHDEWEQWLQNILTADGAWVRTVLSWIFTVQGALWLWWTIYDQIPRLGITGFSAFSVVCLAALAGCWMSVRFDWRAARFLLVGAFVAAFIWATGNLPYFFHAGYIGHDVQQALWLNSVVYLLSIGGALYLLRERAFTFAQKITWFVAVSLGLLLAQQAMAEWGLRFNADWGRLFSVLPLLGTLLLLSGFFSESVPNAVADCKRSIAASSGLILFFNLFPFLTSFTMKGSAVYGLFIPLLNPLELWQGAVILSGVLWIKTFSTHPYTSKGLRWGLPALLFLWINQVAARGTWWRLGEGYFSLWSVMGTAHYQGVIAILWGVLGLLAILYGQRSRNRTLWRLGAGLLAVDMFKLLLIDLNRVATLTRILAFLVLGGLFLLIGWAAPLPPKKSDDEINVE